MSMTPEEYRRAERRLEIGVRVWFWSGIVVYSVLIGVMLWWNPWW